MEDDIVGYFKQVERFDYITIDLDKKFFYMEIVQIETNITLLKISLNLDKDEMVDTVIQNTILHTNKSSQQML
ncbi:hypothetical protein [Bacillus cereus group sp. BfR-BA-01445]|uniref:hypothetical protein n=1 Tax=Bacillus cereus group TaxID=86661 RepID=UPI001F579AA3|nr:hypothetical protein [Bacillus cereus group sp. BfR-BA-01445]